MMWINTVCSLQYNKHEAKIVQGIEPFLVVLNQQHWAALAYLNVITQANSTVLLPLAEQYVLTCNTFCM